MVRTLALAAAVCGVSAAPAMGSQVVVRDAAIHDVYALGRTVVYQRVTGHHFPYHFGLFRVVHGHRVRLRHVPAAGANAIGRDGHGRVVLTLSAITTRHHRITNVKWWLYDVGRQRARRLRSVPSGPCAPRSVTVWWHRVAYTRSCAPYKRDGVFLRDRGQTRRVITQTPAERPLLLRANLLAAVMLEADGDTAIWRLASHRRACRLLIPDSYIEEEWLNKGLWLSGRNLVWAFAYAFDPSESDTVLGARMHGCGVPGPTGSFPAPANLQQPLRVLGIDGRWLYYADAHHLRRERLPRSPDTSPPANDDFENATPLPGDPPITLADQVIGRATVQPGEPTDYSGLRTVWYEFRPTITQRVLVAGPSQAATEVYEGDSLGSLTKVSSPSTTDDGVEFDAVAGHSYHISVGCSGQADAHGFSEAFMCFLPFELRLTAS